MFTPWPNLDIYSEAVFMWKAGYQLVESMSLLQNDT